MQIEPESDLHREYSERWGLHQARGRACANASFRSVGGVSVVEQVFPIGKVERRGVADESVDAPHMAVTYVVEGRARAGDDEPQLELSSGCVAVWRSTQSLVFHVQEPLRILTFLFPDRDLGPSFPQERRNHCAVITPKSPLGPVLSGFFAGLTSSLDDMPERYQHAAMALLNQVVVKALVAQAEREPIRPGDLAFERILEYIERNLHEPQLAPDSVAKAHRISVRYLHLLFSRRGMRVAAWIRRQRLQSCRADIAVVPDSVTITSIALKWGFNDSSHFSRLFSSTYGESPAAYRRRSQRPPPR